MKVRKTLETPEGSVTFEGDLTSEELDLVLGVGLNFLLQQGAIPFKVGRPVNMTEGSENLQ